MRKTARPVVWEGAGAQSPALDPIWKLICATHNLLKLFRATVKPQMA